MSCSDLPGRVTLALDKNVLRSNFRKLAEKIAPCNILSVLKANAYGTGADVMGKLVTECGVNRIGVADLTEAVAMQKAVNNAVPVQILGVVTPEELPCAVANNVVLPIESLAMAEAVSAEAVKQGQQVRVHFISIPAWGGSDFCRITILKI